MPVQIVLIAGPTASGKSSRAIAEAQSRGGEIISVDSRQVYRGLDIGTEKVTVEERRGIPHHLIDIRSANEPYSAGDFVQDAVRLIADIASKGKLPILAGGTHFYFDALLRGLPAGIDANPALRERLETYATHELHEMLRIADPRRAEELDPENRRRIIRALEIVDVMGTVPKRSSYLAPYVNEWIIIDPPAEELRARIDLRLKHALARGLVDEVARVGHEVGDRRLDELGLEYKIVGEFLRGKRPETTLMESLSAKLWQYARRQKAWLRKLQGEVISAEQQSPDRN